MGNPRIGSATWDPSKSGSLENGVFREFAIAGEIRGFFTARWLLLKKRRAVGNPRIGSAFARSELPTRRDAGEVGGPSRSGVYV